MFYFSGGKFLLPPFFIKNEVIHSALKYLKLNEFKNNLKWQHKKKTYQLIEVGNRVNYVQRFPDGTILRYKNPPKSYKPPRKLVFTDEEGRVQVVRYLRSANTIYQDKQKELGFGENVKITRFDSKDVEFVNGFLTTNKQTVIDFLEKTPLFEGWVGDRQGISAVCREFKPQENKKKNISLAQNQANAVIAITKMDADKLDTVLLMLYGGHYPLPIEIEDKQEALLDAINDNELSELAITHILGEPKDDDIEILIGKAINANVISFTQKKGKYK